MNDSQWYLLALDIIETKLYKKSPTKPVLKQPSYILKMSFRKKGVNQRNLPRILNHLFITFFSYYYWTS